MADEGFMAWVRDEMRRVALASPGRIDPRIGIAPLADPEPPGLARNRRARERWVDALQEARDWLRESGVQPTWRLLRLVARDTLNRLNWEQMRALADELKELTRRAP